MKKAKMIIVKATKLCLNCLKKKSFKIEKFSSKNTKIYFESFCWKNFDLNENFLNFLKNSRKTFYKEDFQIITNT